MAKTQFIWDPLSDNVLQEKDELGATQATYTYEPTKFGNLISQDRGGTESYCHYDGLGSTRELTDSSENVTDTNIYDAWGVDVASTGSTTLPFRFCGASGYYTQNDWPSISVRSRRLLPANGRWASADPLMHLDGINRYWYVRNEPVASVDPSGLLTIDPVANNLPATCGGRFDIYWDFVLDRPAPCDGYFVQRIDVNCGIDDECTDCAGLGSRSPKYTYWEAWPVKQFALRQKRSELGFTDLNRVVMPVGTCGSVSVLGTVRFYCKNPEDAQDGVGTGDLGEWGRNPSDGNSKWRIGRKYTEQIDCPSPGDLPSVGEAPEWWKDKPVEGSASRFASAFWCCCTDEAGNLPWNSHAIGFGFPINGQRL